MWNGKLFECFSLIFQETIPTFLLQELSFFYEKARLWRRLHPTSPEMLAGERKVYDLVNCGARSSFVGGPLRPIVLHNCSYGAGPGTIRTQLGAAGIEMGMQEVRSLHASYWKLFGGVKQYEQHLLSMWEKNGGWILNPAGLPQCVAQDKIKDLCNRSVQGGGHYLFMCMTKILSDTFREHGIHYKPYIWDIHDAVFFTVPAEQAARAKELADGLVIARFNDTIKGSVTLRAEANVVDCFWDDKSGG